MSAGYADGTLALVQTITGFVSGSVVLDSFVYDISCAKTNESSKEELSDGGDDPNKKKKISADALKQMMADSQAQQAAYVDAAQKLADVGRELIADKTANLSELLKPLLTQLDDVNSQIKDLETKINNTVSMAKEPTEPTTQAVENEFMEVLIHTDASTTESSGSMNSNSSASSCGVSFWFGGYSQSKSSSSEKNSSKVQNTSKGVTIKFPGPQILGYYLEKTPADESRFLTSGAAQEDISIEEFVTTCKQMIDTVYQS